LSKTFCVGIFRTDLQENAIFFLLASLYPLSACLILEMTRGSAVWINTSVNHGFAIWIYILVDVPLYSLPLIVS
jgi:hypothetical protein